MGRPLLTRRPGWREGLLLLTGLGVALLALELVARVEGPGREELLVPAAGPRAGYALVDGHFEGLYRPDSRLGWVPISSHVGRKWEVAVGTRERGIRSNGRGPTPAPQVLAVGDSYTFGDEVADEDTWPAQLERRIGVGVLNAGVSSYGLDQMLLRAEELLPLYRPRVLVVGLIEDSLTRVGEAVRHGNPKPFFVVGPDDVLELRNVPVPRAAGVPWLRRAFGRSQLASLVLDRVAPQYWWRGTMREFVAAGNDVDRVGERLVDRLVRLAREHGAGLCVLFIDITEQESRSPEITRLDGWLEPYLGPRVRSVHVVHAFTAATGGDPRGLEAFANPLPLVHPNSEGQRIVADVVAPAVEALLRSTPGR